MVMKKETYLKNEYSIQLLKLDSANDLNKQTNKHAINLNHSHEMLYSRRKMGDPDIKDLRDEQSNMCQGKRVVKMTI